MIVPSGYERLLLAHAVAVARSDALAAIRKALLGADGTPSTLHAFAAAQPNARALAGRGTAWAVTLPGGPRVVVRHNRHGGLLAELTGDRFLSPTRAPHELEISRSLLARGVRTPEVVGYVLYPPGRLLQRADVVTTEIPDAADLVDVLSHRRGAARDPAWDSTARLLAALARAGALHPDLNAKNILIASDGALVLDVDRIVLGTGPEAAMEGNLARLGRSLRKWRDRYGLTVTEDEIANLDRRARAFVALR